MIVSLSTFAGGEWRKYHLKGGMKRGTRRGIPKLLKMHIFQEQRGLCTFCDKRICMDPADFDCDHIVPVKYGGPTCRSNLQLLCVRCHRKKSGLERRRDVAVCQPSITVCMSGGAVRVSPQDIRALVTSSRGVFCLQFGDLRLSFVCKKTPPEKRPVVTDGMRDVQKQLRIVSSHLLDQVDITNLGEEGYNLLVNKKIQGGATQEDMAKIKKYIVQKHYSQHVDAEFVNEFTAKKKAIYNRTFLNKFPIEVIRKVHSNTMITGESSDLINPIVHLVPRFEETLQLLGFESVDGSSSTKIKIDKEQISKEAKKSMENLVELCTPLKLDRKPRGATTFSHFNLYLEKVVGLKLKWHRVNRKGQSPSAYSLICTLHGKYLDNTLYSNKWFESHCQNFDLHTNCKVGTELAYMRTLMNSRVRPLMPPSV